MAKGRIDKEKLKKLWNKGSSVTQISRHFGVSHGAVSQQVKKLGLRSKSERIRTGVEVSVSKRILSESEKMYESGIDLMATAKKSLSRLNWLMDLNTREIEESNGSKQSAFQQNQIMKSVFNLTQVLKTLIQFEETFVNVHRYNQLKQAIIEAAERVGPEMKKIFLEELRKAELRTQYIFYNGNGTGGQEIGANGKGKVQF